MPSTNILVLLLTLLTGACETTVNLATLKKRLVLSQEVLEAGQSLHGTLHITNLTDKDVYISELTLTIRSISDSTSQWKQIVPIKTNIELPTGKQKTIPVNLFDKLPGNLPAGAYGIYLGQRGRVDAGEYTTFFRVRKPGEIVVYDIERELYNNIPIYKLDGGMSAEYVVEKSAESLQGAISHSWEINSEVAGPNPVMGTPDFLLNSVNKTVDFYNTALGEGAVFETVIISPGIPSIPYISSALKAPVLPLHFLVSVNSIKEVQSIVETATDQGLASYATLSHDPSVPHAVAWVKLLELPPAYLNFIKTHRVKNVIIVGATGTSGGETQARKVVFKEKPEGNYTSESIYLMYIGENPEATLKDKIIDLHQFEKHKEYIGIADWESGINPIQAENFVRNAKTIPGVGVYTILAEDLIDLYNLGSYVTIKQMAKNRKSAPKGIVFNPYLLSHPRFELYEGFVPLLYWQLIGADYTLDRVEKTLFKAISKYYSGFDKKKLVFWLNSTKNFGGKWSAQNLKKEANARGYSIIKDGSYESDEIWNPNNGMEAPCELMYESLQKDLPSYKNWNNKLQQLSIEDMKELANYFGGFSVTKH